MLAKIKDEVPFAPRLEHIQALPKEDLAVGFELAESAKLGTLQSGQVILFGSKSAQDPEVQIKLFFCQKTTVCRFDFGRLEKCVSSNIDGIGGGFLHFR